MCRQASELQQMELSVQAFRDLRSNNDFRRLVLGRSILTTAAHDISVAASRPAAIVHFLAEWRFWRRLIGKRPGAL
jgi:hypothetical protein